ncbi:MAG: hypothetical protein Q9160_008251 [Pyrenula sp. 1 TL-2023]
MDLPSAVPQFWFGNDLSWSVIARVDNQTYNLFGVPSPAANTIAADLLSGTYTATHSVFVLSAGSAEITLDFFSPVSFKDYVRQSLPFSYLTVGAVGTNGARPVVQVYSDIDDTWTGQSENTIADFTTSGDAAIYRLSAAGQALYAQSANEQALWGEAVFASSPTDGSRLSTASGASATIRGQFVSQGSLSGNHPQWSTSDVFAITHNLGDVFTEKYATFAIGYVREAAINYLGAAQTGYYRATYPDTISAVTHFLSDFDAASLESTTLDGTIVNTATSIAGSNYSDILSLSLTQTFGGIDLTIPNDTLCTSSPSAFIKEISSDGNVNTIDIIVELLPFFSVFNPDWLRLMLDPVISYLESGRYPNPYCIHDIGNSYPVAAGHDDGADEAMPVEESGNLLILAAAYQAFSGDTAWAASHASLFASYADYLTQNGLYPTRQLSTNDGLGPFTNMTQLGVKAAVGLGAYGLLSGNTSYTTTARSFANTIFGDPANNAPGVGVAISDDTSLPYFTLTYNSPTFFMLYNLYPDRLLNLSLFPAAAYEGQSALYATPTARGPYGVALDGNVDWGKTDWQMWSAAVAEEGVKNQMIGDLWRYLRDAVGRGNDEPWADRFWVRGNKVGKSAQGFRARPVLGAHWAVWAEEKLGGG